MAETSSVNVQDRGSAVLVVTATTSAVATVFVALRLVSRFAIVQRGATLDDLFIFLAWIVSFGLSFAICYATRFGLGKHERAVTQDQRSVLDKLNYTFEVVYNPALMLTKTSILVFYLTLAGKTQKWLKRLAIVDLVIVNAGGLGLFFANTFQCRPVEAAFNELSCQVDTHCIEFVTLYLSSAPINLVTDLVILISPFPVIKDMRLPRKQKIILFITFGFGLFAAAVDIVRIYYLEAAAVTRAREAQSTSNSQSSNYERTDFSWYAALTFMWSAVEVNIGIMCACVPALKPLAVRFMPRLVRDTVMQDPEKPRSNATMGSSEMAAEQRIPSFLSQGSAEQPGQTGSNALDFITTPGAAHYDGSDDQELDVKDFLTSPNDAELPRNLRRTDTMITNYTANTRSPAFLDFVRIDSTKSIVYMTNRESIKPITQVTVLFFIWGFAYGLLNSLNSQVQLIANLSSGQTIAIHGMYYAGYLVASLTYGRWVLRHWGFKACYTVGLLIYGTGTLVFWPAAVLLSFPAFMISNFIVGMGLSTLEIAANPFIALCGPPQYSEMRLNLSQGFQAIGTVVSPLLAKKALFQNVLDAPSLIDVQWTYLGICIFTYMLAVVYHIIKLPEASDEDLEEAATQTHPDTLSTLRTSNTIWYTLAIATFAQFCYVGGQESVATSLTAYLHHVSPAADAVNYDAVGHTLFAASRFLSALLGFFLKPRHQLIFWVFGTIVFSALAMNFSGTTAGAMVMCVFFFEGPLFALLYAIPLRAMGRSTKDAAALITAFTSGGALFPGIFNEIATPGGSSGNQYAYCTVVATSAATALLPLYLCLFPLAKEQVDPTLPGEGDAVPTRRPTLSVPRTPTLSFALPKGALAMPRRPTFSLPRGGSFSALTRRRRRERKGSLQPSEGEADSPGVEGVGEGTSSRERRG